MKFPDVRCTMFDVRCKGEQQGQEDTEMHRVLMDEIFAAAKGGLKKLRESHDVWCSMIDVQVEMQRSLFYNIFAVLSGSLRPPKAVSVQRSFSEVGLREKLRQVK